MFMEILYLLNKKKNSAQKLHQAIGRVSNYRRLSHKIYIAAKMTDCDSSTIVAKYKGKIDNSNGTRFS